MNDQMPYNTKKCPNKKGKFKAHIVEENESEDISAQFIEEEIINIHASTYNKENYIETLKNKKNDKGTSKMEFKDDGWVDPSDIEKNHIFYTDNGNATYMIYIVCFANSGTTSYIFNQHNLFTNYHPIYNTFVGSVSRTKTYAIIVD